MEVACQKTKIWKERRRKKCLVLANFFHSGALRRKASSWRRHRHITTSHACYTVHRIQHLHVPYPEQVNVPRQSMAISLKTQNYPPAMNKNSRVNLVIVATLCSSNYTVGREKKRFPSLTSSLGWLRFVLFKILTDNVLTICSILQGFSYKWATPSFSFI